MKSVQHVERVARGPLEVFTKLKSAGSFMRN